MEDDKKAKRKDAGELIEETAGEPLDPEVMEEFKDADRLGSGSEQWQKKLEEHNASSPKLTSGDVDADWERADDVGDEAAAASVATPDQDVVEELSGAMGITYQDTEPLRSSEKIKERDRDRWELDPASSEDYEKRAREQAKKKR